MASNDFTRTSSQLQRDIMSLIDSVDRSLDSSSGDSERKGQLVLSGFISVVVFVSILAFDHFVAIGSESHVATSDAAKAELPSATANRDLRLLEVYLDRVEMQARTIRDTKRRVAPSMPIDSNLDAIGNAVVDVRGLFELKKEE